MSDELDPELSRLFAEAGQDLPGQDFQARLAAGLARRRSPFAIGSMVAAIVLAVSSGIAHGVFAPFGARRRHVGLMAASGAVVMVWLTYQMS